MRPSYIDYGSVEGIVQPHPREEEGFINLWDDVNEVMIPCEGTPEQANTLAIKHGGQRVTISGDIAHNEDGKPLGVKIKTFGELYRPPHVTRKDVRGHEDVRGMFKDVEQDDNVDIPKDEDPLDIPEERHTITVAGLIELLADHPPNLPVLVRERSGRYWAPQLCIRGVSRSTLDLLCPTEQEKKEAACVILDYT